MTRAHVLNRLLRVETARTRIRQSSLVVSAALKSSSDSNQAPSHLTHLQRTHARVRRRQHQRHARRFSLHRLHFLRPRFVRRARVSARARSSELRFLNARGFFIHRARRLSRAFRAARRARHAADELGTDVSF